MQQEFLGPAPLHPRDNNNQRKTIPLKDFEAKKKEINELLNSKAKELKELGLLDKLGEFVGIQTDNAKQRESQLNDIKDVAVKNKTDFKDLPSALKDEYYNKAETSILKPLKTKNEIAKEDYQKDLQRQAILQKTTQELTQNDKELINNDSGFFNRALDVITGKSEVEKLKEYKEKEKAKDITKDLQKSWNLFNSLRKDKDAFSLFASEDLQLREKYQNEFKNIARNSGFDDVVYNEKHEPFVRKGDKFYKINDRFFDNFLNFLSANKFSLSGSLIGAASGAKAGKNLGALGLLGGAIVGGALGSTAGGATDAIAGNAFLNREQKADEIIRHALSDGALSLVTDTLVLGAGKFIKKAINPRSIFNIGANASTGGLYALGKHIVTGNAKGAEIILNETISENERQAVRELAKRFGGELRLSKADESKYREELIKKVGEDSKILKGYDALRDAFLLQSQAKKQEAFIQAIRSDETGNAVAFLSEAANSSPIANANLKKILNKTTENLKNSLRQFDLKDYEVKSIFDNLEQGTKESYEKALDGVIGKLYDNSYKTNLRESIQDATVFKTFVKELKEQGKFDPTASSFLNQIEKNIYSPEGVTYNQLRNARQMINAYERNVKDPSTLGYMNFKESVISRLQDTNSNITILMQRLGDNDLCGFLQSEREFDIETIKKWKIIQLKALNENQEIYKIKDFEYTREKETPLFEAKHNKQHLEALRLQMGNDEFSAQYQQDPIVSSGGYFDPEYLKKVFTHELGEMNTYIFVDNALSLSRNADNRAIVVVGVENYKESVRYIVLDCFFGIWSEEDTIKHILAAKEKYKDAKTFIESDGGGLVLYRLLLVALARHNEQNKQNYKELLNDEIICYTPSRRISKVDKIKALRPFYNTGFLVFSHSSNNTEQIEKELFSFNPDKPFKKDDCIDALASALTHESVKAPLKREIKASYNARFKAKPTWRI